MAVPTLNPEEFQYLDTGITLNTTAVLPFVDLEKISGVDGPSIRSVEKDREGRDGGYVDAQYEMIRTVTLEGTIYASVANMETYLDQLKANFAPQMDAQPLYFGTDAGTRMVLGKPGKGLHYDKDTLRRLGLAKCQIIIACEDPRIYTPSQVIASVSPSSSALTGRAYNKSYNYGYGSGGASNTAILVLGGNRDQPGTIHIAGPINNPQVINDRLGIQMNFNISLSSTDYLDIDLNTRTVMLNGTANRRNTMTLVGGWYLLQPGSNTFRLNGTGTVNGTTQLSVTAYSAAWR